MTLSPSQVVSTLLSWVTFLLDEEAHDENLECPQSNHSFPLISQCPPPFRNVKPKAIRATQHLNHVCNKHSGDVLPCVATEPCTIQVSIFFKLLSIWKKFRWFHDEVQCWSSQIHDEPRDLGNGVCPRSEDRRRGERVGCQRQGIGEALGGHSFGRGHRQISINCHLPAKRLSNYWSLEASFITTMCCVIIASQEIVRN